MLGIKSFSKKLNQKNRERVLLCNNTISLISVMSVMAFPSSQKPSQDGISAGADSSRVCGAPSGRAGSTLHNFTQMPTSETHKCITLPGSPTFRQVMNRVREEPPICRGGKAAKPRPLSFILSLDVEKFPASTSTTQHSLLSISVLFNVYLAPVISALVSVGLFGTTLARVVRVGYPYRFIR